MQFLQNLYENSLYKLALFGTEIVNTILLKVIRFKGLDPNMDVEALKIQKLTDELGAQFGRRTKRSVMKIPVHIRQSEHDVKHNAYRVKDNVPYGAVPDFSDAGSLAEEPRYVTQTNVEETIQRLMDKYKPAYEARPFFPETALEVTESSINDPFGFAAEDKRVFDILDGAASYLEEKPKRKLAKKKTTKKPASKSRKK